LLEVWTCVPTFLYLRPRQQPRGASGDIRTSFDVAAIIRSEIALQGCYAYSWEDLHRAVAWLAAGFVPMGSWIDVRPLEAGPDAFLELMDRPGVATKIVMVP
jgi:threonine dehydrogenase-like Zn-dependent dehydrogenase